MIDSYSKLKDYCLRRLGAPVINIELQEEQIKDRINDAIQLFTQKHYDGSEEVNYQQIVRVEDEKAGYMILDGISSLIKVYSPNNAYKTNGEILDDIDYQFAMEIANHPMSFVNNGLTSYYITREHLATMRFMLGNDLAFSHNSMTKRFTPYFKLTSIGTNSFCEDFGDTWTTTGATILENGETWVDGNETADLITFDATGSSISYSKETPWYPRGAYTGRVKLYGSGVSDVQLKLKLSDKAGNLVSQKTITVLSGQWGEFWVQGTFKDGNVNDVVFTIEAVTDGCSVGGFNPFLYFNNFYIFGGYNSVLPENEDSIWDVKWIKDYATALLKYQWGMNLIKYNGTALLGGMTVSGQFYIDEGKAEMEKLEQLLDSAYTAPAMMYIG